MSSNAPGRKARAKADRESREQAKQAQQRRQRLLLGGVGVAVLALAVLIGVLSVGESEQREDIPSVDEVAGDPEIEGENLSPAAEDPSDDPELGSRAPEVTGAGFDGEPVTLGEEGQPQLIAFMASWCPACGEEMPDLVNWLDGGNLPDDVELVSVSTSLDRTRPNWPPQDWFEENGFDAPIIVDDGDSSIAQAYGLTATPYWVALDGDGEVVARIAGIIGQDRMTALAQEVSGT